MPLVMLFKKKKNDANRLVMLIGVSSFLKLRISVFYVFRYSFSDFLRPRE